MKQATICLIILMASLTGCVNKTLQPIEVRTSFGECADPPELVITDRPKGAHFGSLEIANWLAQTVETLSHHVKKQDEAINCYKTQSRK